MACAGWSWKSASQKHTIEPDAMLGQIRGTNEPGIYALCDLHPYLDGEPKHVRLLKEIALHHERLHHTLVLISHQFSIPGNPSLLHPVPVHAR